MVDKHVLEEEVGPVEVELAYGPVERISGGPVVQQRVTEDARLEGGRLALHWRHEDEELEGHTLGLTLGQEQTIWEGPDALLVLELFAGVDGLEELLVEGLAGLGFVVHEEEVVAVALDLVRAGGDCKKGG